ncbi:hypothetical protein D4R52_01300 [bacterium]|nr:MAG: hypothetical protein D4R52_01300 [bacterium]
MLQAEDYKKLVTEIITKQIDILGPDMAVRRAKNVAGLEVRDDGTVVAIQGDPDTVLRELVDQYITLSGQIVKNILGPIFAKYPDVKFDLK